MKAQFKNFTGSLLLGKETLASPYDYSHPKFPEHYIIDRVSTLKDRRFHNASLRPFQHDYTRTSSLCILNGMGVTLGDSLVGLSTIDAIRDINKNIEISIIRPRLAPSYVEDIYSLSSGLVDNIIYMPCNLTSIKKHDIYIDVGNQLYWPSFNKTEMHDFFLNALGLKSQNISPEFKQNKWITNITIVPTMVNIPERYVLFNPSASTPLRSIPECVWDDFIDVIYQTHGLPILGFHQSSHPCYKNISSYSSSTSDYLQLIAGSDFIYCSDSSALHIAAGYSIPTIAFFNSIPPQLRSYYYPQCSSIYMGLPETLSLHESNNPKLLSAITENYIHAINIIKDNGFDALCTSKP